MPAVRYVGYVTIPTRGEIADIMDEWESMLKGARDKIKTNLGKKIPDEPTFKLKIAEMSNIRYRQYVNPEYLRANIILMKHKVKLGQAYSKWRSGVDSAFAPDGVFEKNVTAKKDKFYEVKYTLGAVGKAATLLWGPVVKATYTITGDPRVKNNLRPDDVLEGEVVNAFVEAYTKFLRPMMISKSVEACVLASYAHLGDLISERNAILSDHKSFMDTLFSKFLKAGATAEMEIEFDEAVGKFKVTATASVS